MIDVVVPCLNEPDRLAATLSSLRDQSRRPEKTIVVDGGSTAGPPTFPDSPAIEVISAPRGRGSQIAAGVIRSRSEIVVVAHADMRFPPTAIETIANAMIARPDCPGGCLGHRFDGRRLSLQVIERWDRVRARRGYSYGDQAQFFRRAMLDQVGGVPALPLMEDVELARRLRLLGRPIYLNLPVVVSARRYDRLGWPRVMWMNWRLRTEYHRRGPHACAELYARYYAPR